MITVRRIVLATLLALGAAACGGGGGSAGLGVGGGFDTGIGGSGGLVGTAQGFGSIIVNDVVMDVDAAEFEIEGENAGMGLAGQGRLREGQQLVILGDVDAGEASDVFYRSDIRAPLESAPVFDPLTGAGEMTVLGQTVKTRAVTRFSGGASLDTLQVGDVVEVSGARDATGALLATFIELTGTLGEYKVVGRVGAVGTPGFSIGGLTVNTESAGITNPSVGDLVEVRIDAADFVAGEPAVALRVERLDDIDVVEGGRLEVEGFVDTFASASRFSVGGIPVSVEGAVSFERGDADDLGLNVRIEVEGLVSASGRVLAERILFKPTDAVRVEGRVADGGIDLSERTITTAVGITFVVRALTELEDDSAQQVEPFRLEDLAPGDFVEVRGFLDGNAIVAAEVEREDADPGVETRFRAPADAPPTINAEGNLEVSLLGVTVVGTAASTVFEDDNDGPLTQSQFAALVSGGTVVEAGWDNFVSRADVAASLSIEEEDD